jgi:hypothetical protein
MKIGIIQLMGNDRWVVKVLDVGESTLGLRESGKEHELVERARWELLAVQEQHHMTRRYENGGVEIWV